MTWEPVLASELDLSREAPFACAGHAASADLAVVCTDGRWYALDRWCPHAKGDLAEGLVVAGALKCPRHGFMFDLATGQGLSGVRYAVRTYEARAEGGELFVKADDIGDD